MKKGIKRLATIIKRPFLSLRKNHFGKGSIIENNVLMRNTRIGKYCYIGPNGCYNNVVVGNYCSLSVAVQIGGMEHSYWEISTSTYLSDSCVNGKRTTIGNDVWIGADCIIRQGITIGNGAVVGANSFVNKDVPPYAIVFGNPAKVYKYRFSEGLIKRIEDSEYWNYPPEKAKKIIKSLIQR